MEEQLASGESSNEDQIKPNPVGDEEVPVEIEFDELLVEVDANDEPRQRMLSLSRGHWRGFLDGLVGERSWYFPLILFVVFVPLVVGVVIICVDGNIGWIPITLTSVDLVSVIFGMVFSVSNRTTTGVNYRAATIIFVSINLLAIGALVSGVLVLRTKGHPYVRMLYVIGLLVSYLTCALMLNEVLRRVHSPQMRNPDLADLEMTD